MDDVVRDGVALVHVARARPVAAELDPPAAGADHFIMDETVVAAGQVEAGGETSHIDETAVLDGAALRGLQVDRALEQMEIGLILLVVTLIINALARLLIWSVSEKAGGAA